MGGAFGFAVECGDMRIGLVGGRIEPAALADFEFARGQHLRHLAADGFTRKTRDGAEVSTCNARFTCVGGAEIEPHALVIAAEAVSGDVEQIQNEFSGREREGAAFNRNLRAGVDGRLSSLQAQFSQSATTQFGCGLYL